MRQPRMLLVLLALVFLVASPIQTLAQAKGPDPVGLRPDAPDYAKHGPFWVGMREFVLEDKDHPLTVNVWYPALNPTNAKESATYTVLDYVAIRMAFPDQKDWTMQGAAIVNAPPDSSRGPYPLVIYSHGRGGWTAAGLFLAEHLASMGFVVMAAQHYGPGESPVEFVGRTQVVRLQDVRRELVYAEKISAAGGVLAGMVDSKHSGIIGHSDGGSTALLMGGARFDLTAFAQQCAKNPDDPQNQSDCPMLNDIPKMLDLTKQTSAPVGPWPDLGDPRIIAVVSQAGSVGWLGPTGLASLKVPALVEVGTTDSYGYSFATTIYDSVSSAQKAQVVFNGADHFVFTTKCSESKWAMDIGFAWVCSDPVWDMDRAHDLINHLTTAFLLDTLKGDQAAHKALLPDAVTFPGVTYKTTLK